MFNYRERRKNPPRQRIGSQGFREGWNSLPHPSSLKDTELAELINGIYSQYGSISKRQGCQIIGSKPEGSTRVINAKMFYDIGGSDYMLRITDTGKLERFNFSTNAWVLLTGTPPSGYSGTDPEFIDNSPVFNTSVHINMVQVQGQIYFSSSQDRVVIFDGSSFKVYEELDDPTTKPQVAKTGDGTGTRSYFYRYIDLNEFGHTDASPANTGSESDGDGFKEDMPEIDGGTYLTVTLPAATAGTTRRMIFRGDVAGAEFFLAEIPADQTVYVDKNINPYGQEGVNFLYLVPDQNTTPGYHFYLMDTFAGAIVGTTVEEGSDVLVMSAGGTGLTDPAGNDKIDSFALADGAEFDGYHRGDGQRIRALLGFSVANKDGLAVFKDSRTGLLEFDPEGGINIQNVNVIRGTMSPFSPHVAGNNIRFYSSEGVASLGHEENYGTILRYTVMSLKADALTSRVHSNDLPKVCSAYFKNLSLFGITATSNESTGNNSILVYDERYNTWSYWTGLHPAVMFKAIHPTTKVEELYFGVSNASEFGGNIVKMFQGKTDYATSTGTGRRITLSLTTKQYDSKLPDRFKKYDKAILVFGSLFGNGTTVQPIAMGANGIEQFPRFRISTNPTLSGFGNDEWGDQEVGMMSQDSSGETLNIRYINLRQRDFFWVKLNIQEDSADGEFTLLGVFFYLSESERQLPSRSRIQTIA